MADRSRSSTRGPVMSGDVNGATRGDSQEPRGIDNRVDSFPSSAQGDETCDDCQEPDPDTFFCNDCNVFLCKRCWPKQLAHRTQRIARGGPRHEKTDISLARKINNVLMPTSDPKELTQLHEDDAETAWFGVQRPQDGRTPSFLDYGRFSHLLASTVEAWNSRFQYAQSSRDNRTPSLVSFVGQTGHGKSTLIKLLIDLHLVGGQTGFSTPVVGAPGVTDPTSENVHLYLDPVTALTETPLFLADCEGLLGGEREPLSAKLRRSKTSKSTPLPTPISERELAWADSSSLRSRQYAVTNLYPRLLYTFADLIVFVLKNPRAIEDVLEHLVEWAAAALEKASNQPVLPHVIIALNASENSIDESLWDPEVATQAVLESLSRTVNRNNTFKKYAQFWRERNRQVDTAEQLIRSYYSSIKVVRIPEQGRPQLIQTQIKRLYAGIAAGCKDSRERKAKVRMLLDAEELQSYLQCAFDHFARSLDHPFDFVQASFSDSPIPLDFGGNILKLAISMMHVWKNKIEVNVIFQELSYLVSSCIMFDSARKKNLGMAREIFPQYLEHLDAALENFCESHWPCEYVEPKSGLRCVNVKSGHGGKGHQNANGKIFADGDYESKQSFDELREEFASNCFFRLQELLERIDALRLKRGMKYDEVDAAAEIHRDDVLPWFFRHVSGDEKAAQYNSHSVCLCCLLRPPEHALPCGHVLCTRCISDYGSPRQGSRTEIEIEYCPLEVRSVHVSQPWRVHLKPDAAGIRILTLDGGGIRGIIELEYLQNLEKALNRRNGKLRVQNFFDLVIGTSTGGLIALGLVARDWRVDKCTAKFKELCQQAFTQRTMGNIPLLGFFVENYYHSRYETQPFVTALQSAFSPDQYLFGGERYEQTWNSPVKVAVTTTLSSTSPVLLANYNRRCDDKLSYQFQRAESVETEMKIWEAARATSAAPRYFKPFHHEESKQTYLDGALYHNNPVGVADSEWKLIWGSNLCSHPDIILSLGTGYDPQKRQRPHRGSAMRPGIVRNGKFLLKIAADHIEDALDCEKTWDEYIRRIPEGISRSRFVRYSPELVKSLPSLDDVYLVESLHKDVAQLLSSSAETMKIQNLAMQLVATSFYFETSPEKVYPNYQNTATVTGRIYCRFTDGSLELKELGMLIREKMSHNENPYFSVQECGASQRLIKKYELSYDTIHDMTRGKFIMPLITIQLDNKLSESVISFSLKPGHIHPVSAFPRCLIDDEKGKTRTLNPTTVHARRWAGRTNSRRYLQSMWQPPDRAASNLGRTFQSYHDSDHVMGFATAEQLQRSASYFSQGRDDAVEIDSRGIYRPAGPVELATPYSLTELPNDNVSHHRSNRPNANNQVQRDDRPDFVDYARAETDQVLSWTGNNEHVPSCPVCDSALPGLAEREITVHVNACLDRVSDTSYRLEGTRSLPPYHPQRPAPPEDSSEDDAFPGASARQTSNTQLNARPNIPRSEPSSAERIAMYNRQRDMWARQSQTNSNTLAGASASAQDSIRSRSTKEHNAAQPEINRNFSYPGRSPGSHVGAQDRGAHAGSSSSRPSTSHTQPRSPPSRDRRSNEGMSAYQATRALRNASRMEDEDDEWHDTTEWFR